MKCKVCSVHRPTPHKVLACGVYCPPPSEALYTLTSLLSLPKSRLAEPFLLFTFSSFSVISSLTGDRLLPGPRFLVYVSGVQFYTLVAASSAACYLQLGQAKLVCFLERFCFLSSDIISSLGLFLFFLLITYLG